VVHTDKTFIFTGKLKMQHIDYSTRVPVRESYDIIVSGGGVAGAAAALAAARAGKKVMLIEKTTLLGGLATIGLINYFVPMCNGNGTKIIKGMAEEFFRLSIKNGYHTIPEVWQDGKTPADPLNSPRYTTRYSAQIFALELTKLLDDAGVTLRFDSIVSDAIMENGVCQGIIVESKSGKEYFPAKVFIDTTGDADLLARADIPTIQGKNYLTYIGYTVSFDTCRKALVFYEYGNIFIFIVRLIDFHLRTVGTLNFKLDFICHTQGYITFDIKCHFC
jgi:flavin-dependent dehydrogenase